MKKVEFSVDRDLRVLSCSEYWRDGRIRSPAECLERPYHELVPPIFIGDKDAVAAALADGQPLHLADHRYRCIYESISAPATIRPLRDETGAVTGAEVLIEFPAGCIFVNRLSTSRSLIDIGKSASMLAHGVRNPLNAIKGAVVYLKSRYLQDETFLEFADIIEQEIDSLDKFVTCFLSSSFDAFDSGEIDLNDLLRKAQAVIGLQTAASLVAVNFALEGELPVRGNPFQIEQALMNILNNALQAMPNGGSIFISSGIVRNARGAFAQVEIADDGPGLPEGFVKAVTTPAAEGVRKGRGFGLFIAREVFQSHGGSMEIRSEPGRGTTVVLKLPVREG